MSENALLAAAITCAVPYGGAILILLCKNWQSVTARFVALGAILVWPALFFMSFMQLIFVIPLYTLFLTSGWTLPAKLPGYSVGFALALTLLFLALMSMVAITRG